MEVRTTHEPSYPYQHSPGIRKWMPRPLSLIHRRLRWSSGFEPHGQMRPGKIMRPQPWMCSATTWPSIGKNAKLTTAPPEVKQFCEVEIRDPRRVP